MKLSSLRAASFAALVLLPFSAGPGASQTLQGMVFDGVSRAPIPLARVVVVDSAFTELRATVTDAAGIFSLDGSKAAYLVADRTGYAASAPIDLATAAGNHVIVTLAPRTRETDEVTTVAGTGDGATSFIFGQVIDSESFRGLGGAEIELVGRGKVAVSGESGRFSIEDVQPGILVVRISHLAFETREYTLSPEAGLAYQFMVPLAPDAIELEGIEVVARPRPLARRLQDVYERLEVSQGGYFRTELDFARRGYPVVARILEAVPSVRMQKQGGLWNIQIRGCSPAFYVDGVRVAQAGDTWALSEFLNEPTMGIEVIEVFPGAATLPPEYNDPGTMCAVAAWTRRGG